MLNPTVDLRRLSHQCILDFKADARMRDFFLLAMFSREWSDLFDMD